MKKLIIACAAVLVLGLGLTTVGHVLGGQFYSVYYNGALHPFSDAAQNFSDKFVNISDHIVTADDDDDSDFDTDWVQDYLETRRNAIEGYSLPKQSLDHITSIDLTLKGGDFEILYVSGAGTDVIKVRGVSKLSGGCYTIIPDQIEAGTYMAAAAAVGGDVTVDNVIPKHLDCITAKLREMGAKVTEYDDAIRVEADHRLRRSNVKTMPYPGFPTDMQPQIAVCMALAEGTSLVTEGIYDNRFRYTAELNRMGASIQVESKTAVIDGVTQLHGCEVRACDLRAGAAMVIAALCAEGTTTIEDAHYIERGYEDIIGKFSAIGGKIRRIETFEGNSQSAAG